MTIHTWNGGENKSIDYVNGDTINISGVSATSLSFSFQTGQLILAGASFSLTMNSASASAADLGNLSFVFADGSALRYTSGNLTGTSGVDYIIGSADANTLSGGFGSDKLEGLAGNDYLRAGGDADTLYGGDGNDTLDGVFRADNSHDMVGDTSYGGAGTDTLYGGGGSDLLSGGADNDQLHGYGGQDTLDGGDGGDYMAAEEFYSTAVDAQGDVFYGGAGNDTMFGASAADTMDGGADNDYLDGKAGNNVLGGGAGNDTVFGGVGNDTMDGGDDNDYLDGKEGNNVLNGGAGADTVYGGVGNDTFDGGTGNDRLIGSAGANVLNGGEGNDSLYGGTETDTMDGGVGDDYLSGGTGSNWMIGGDGNDSLYGGADSDTLDGGLGNNYLQGQAGDDTYLIRSRTNTISDSGGNDSATVYVDWFKPNTAVENWTYAEGVQQLPYWIDALTFSSTANLGTAIGASKIVYYSFPTTAPAFFSANDLNGFNAFTADQIAYTRAAMDYISSLVDVTFVETTASNQAYTIYLANNTQDGSAGYAATLYAGGGSVLMIDTTANTSNPSNDDGYSLYRVLMHELGHSLGMKHPFSEAPYLPASEDTVAWSVMSYTGFKGSYDEYSPFDLATLQYIYGVADTANAGDTLHTLTDASCNFIYDGAGNDSIDGHLLSSDLTLYLEAGYWSYIGSKAETISSAGQITINISCVIENAAGGSGHDLITGNSAGNDLSGNAGNDSLIGGSGIDTMNGGDGADTYSVQDSGDTVNETNSSTSAPESDLVLSYLADYTLTGNVEQGRIMNATAANLTGNTLDNTLFAGTGNNVLNGGAGLDTVSYALGASAGVSVSLAVATAQATGGSGSDTLSLVENLIGTAFVDKLTGSTGANALWGGAGADSMYGGLGNDTLYGGDGADNYSVQDTGDVVIESNATVSAAESDLVYIYIANYTLTDNVEQGRLMNTSAANLTGNAMNNSLFAAAGANLINGMAGTDTLSYAYGAISGVTVSLALATAQATGGSGSDTLTDIENLIGSAFADNLTGSSGGNALTGGAGNDVLDGGAGNDTMLGSDGADTFYVREAADVVLETNTSSATTESDLVLSYLTSYTLGSNVEQGRAMLDTAANLTGNTLANTLFAGSGDNVLNGAGGLDTASYAYSTGGVALYLDVLAAQGTGGSGSDTLTAIENLIGSNYADQLGGDSGANALTGGLGNDTLDGSVGIDTMAGGDGADVYTVDNAADVVLETNTSTSATESDLVQQYLSSYTLGAYIEQGRIMSETAADMTGNALDNILFSGAGDNVLTGDAGSDTVSYLYSGSGVSVSLALAGAQASGYGSDTLVGIENLEGSTFNDALNGNDEANALAGGEGSDTLDSGLGDDILDGGAGDDTMTGGDGADTYHVRDALDAVIETNASTGAGESDLVLSYVADHTLAANVEQGRVMGTGNLTGNALNNVFYASVGNNVLNGAAGLDTASYALATSAVSVSLAVTTAQATGGSGSDSLSAIENLIGSDYADKLTGTSLANGLTGGLGNDSLYGGYGSDTMSGGDGADIYSVQDAGDVVIETNASVSADQSDHLYSYLASYTLADNIERGTIMNATAANLTGNSMDNLLYAGKGDNVISGAAGLDTVSYATGAVSAVSISLALASAQATGGSGSDTLVAIENLIGTAFADKLTGSTGANALGGGAGNDSLYGGFGSDTMTGGDGADTYSVQDLTDVIVETNSSIASTESDFAYSYVADYTLSANIEQGRIMNATAANLTGNAAANTLFAGTGNNVLNGAGGTDTVSYAFGAASAVTVSLAVAGSQATGGSGSDTLTLVENLIGTSFADVLTGDGVANALSGGAGNDTLDGGIGNDVLTGGAGLDVLTGGAGNDIFAYASASDTGATAGTRDTIADFVQGQDKIDLSLIDANTATVANDAFTAMLGSADAFTAAGQLRITDNVLYVNTDADADAEFAIELTGVSTLAIGDFIP